MAKSVEKAPLAASSGDASSCNSGSGSGSGGSSGSDSDDATSGEMSWILPLRCHWKGHSPKELQARAVNQMRDFGVIPLFGLWYLFQAWVATSPDALAVQAGTVPADGWLVPAARWVLAAVAVWVLMVHSLAFPAPTEDLDSFRVQSRIGRWCYLTRHCLCLQAWHMLLSALATSFFPWLVPLTNGAAVWIGGLGWFVTIQYFSLLVPSEPFREDCELWATRGVQFRAVSDVAHVPALLLALGDILVCKSGPGLSQAVSFWRTELLVLVYTLTYLSVIVVNHKATGCWPYGFMKQFGTDLGKWAKFICTQGVILTVFASVNLGFMKVKVDYLS